LEPIIVNPQSCRCAFKENGLIEIGAKIYSAVIGTSNSHLDFVVGGLDDSNNCKTEIFHNVKTGKSFGAKLQHQSLRFLCLKKMVLSLSLLEKFVC